MILAVFNILDIGNGFATLTRSLVATTANERDLGTILGVISMVGTVMAGFWLVLACGCCGGETPFSRAMLTWSFLLNVVSKCIGAAYLMAVSRRVTAQVISKAKNLAVHA